MAMPRTSARFSGVAGIGTSLGTGLGGNRGACGFLSRCRPSTQVGWPDVPAAVIGTAAAASALAGQSCLAGDSVSAGASAANGWTAGAAWLVGTMLAAAAAGMPVAQLFPAGGGKSPACPAAGVAACRVVPVGCEAQCTAICGSDLCRSTFGAALSWALKLLPAGV